MIIKYGIENNNIDITNICMKKLLNNDIITIPSNDHIRNMHFTDPIVGTFKKIFVILNDKTNEYPIDYRVEINLKTNEILSFRERNNWIVLLTTAVSNFQNTINDTEYRKNLYDTQISKWLNNTSYTIVVVESSGYTFPNLNHERLHKVSLNITEDIGTRTQYEAYSIINALNNIKDKSFYHNCSHILKVTGRYFLEDIENYLNNQPFDKDLYLQKHRSDGWQNSEYFGIKKELFLPFAKTVQKHGDMEQYLYNYSVNKSFYFIGYFKNNIRRGGDNRLYDNL